MVPARAQDPQVGNHSLPRTDNGHRLLGGDDVGGQTVGYGTPFGYLDVIADNFIAPNDALAIINAINAGQVGEGESAPGSLGSYFAADADTDASAAAPS